MAKKNFDAEIRDKVNDAMNDVRDKMDATYIHDVTLNTQEMAPAFKAGATKFATRNLTPEKRAQLKPFNTVEKWRTAIENVNSKLLGTVKDVKAGPQTLQRFSDIPGYMAFRGVYLIGRSQGSITLRFYNKQAGGPGNSTKFSTFNKNYRQKVWDEWFKVNNFKGGKGVEKSDEMSGVEKGVIAGESPFAHDTTVGMEAMREMNEQFQLDQSLETYYEGIFAKDIHTLALWKAVQETLKVEWDEEVVMNASTGLPEMKRVVSGSIVGRPKNLSNSQAGDWVNLRKEFLNTLDDFLQDAKPFSKSKAFDFESSEPFKKQVGRAAAEKIVKEVLSKNKNAKANKKSKSYKKPPKRTSTPVKPSGKGVGIERALVLSKAGKATRPQQDKREAQDNILKIQRLINKRLPAQVRRNMGKPALTNRTGIFSNSAELVSLRQTKAGLSGEYTYMKTGGGTSKNRKGVYATFENTGVKNWPTGYNPKPLIAKSIRDLAINYTTQKLVSLRRI